MFNVKSITKNLQPAIGLTLGSVGSGIAVKYLTVVKDENIKDAIVALGGLVLMGSGKGKDKMMGHVGMGMVAGVGARLVQRNFPGIAGIGDPDIDFDIDDVAGPGDNTTVSGAESEEVSA